MLTVSRNNEYISRDIGYMGQDVHLHDVNCQRNRDTRDSAPEVHGVPLER